MVEVRVKRTRSFPRSTDRREMRYLEPTFGPQQDLVGTICLGQKSEMSQLAVTVATKAVAVKNKAAGVCAARCIEMLVEP